MCHMYHCILNIWFSSGEEVIEIVEEADDESSDNEAMSDDQEEEDEEDREMDELMRSHRHHLPDTDEEVVNQNNQI